MIETMLHIKRHLTSFQIMILGFAGVILLGALVLMLPIATVQPVSYTHLTLPTTLDV